ncbi:hypothetical protein QR680_008696 [Steinernema hermaphroditum]|uniref:Peptidase M14 domain-containing protein n=1 Tax=Steinernema hermaphroditum TaxID=289476 RepID=A0AA39IIZ1_9BILA|nr:hypothetical protein QR680_008696 [Steinernema hermaphroditum]
MTGNSVAEIASTSSGSEHDAQPLTVLFVKLIKGIVEEEFQREQQFQIGSAIARRVKGTHEYAERNFFSFLQAEQKKPGRSKKNSETSPSNGFKVKKRTENDDKANDKITLPMVLDAITKVEDDIACCMIAWLYREYTKRCSSKVRLRRVRAFIRLKATIKIAEVLTPRLEGDDWKSAKSKQDVINFLSEALMVTERDRFFSVRLNKASFHSHISDKVLDVEFMRRFPKILNLIKKSINLLRFVDVVVSDYFPAKFINVIDTLETGASEDKVKLLQFYLKLGHSLFRSNTHLKEWLDANTVETIFKVFQSHVGKRSKVRHFAVAVEAALCLQVLLDSDMARVRLSSEISTIGQLLDDVSLEEHTTSSLKTALMDIGIRLLPQQNFPCDNLDTPVYEFPLRECLHEASLNNTFSTDMGSFDRTRASFDFEGEASDDDVGEQNGKASDTEDSRNGRGFSESDRESEQSDDDGEANTYESGLDDSDLPPPDATSTPLKDSKTGVKTDDSENPSGSTSGRLLSGIELQQYDHLFKEYINGCDSSRIGDCIGDMNVTSVGKFVKKAFPDTVTDAKKPHEASDLLDTSSNIGELSQAVAKEIHAYQHENKTNQKRKRELVFDLDELVAENNSTDMTSLELNAEKPLHFESRFESGNLRKAYRVGNADERHYELVLSPDIGSNRPHYQWFYFEVSNNEAGKMYTFDIINCSKATSMFSKGMQPVVFSAAQYKECKQGWIRDGANICYYRNRYISYRPGIPKKALKGKRKEGEEGYMESMELCHHYTLRFQLIFRKSADITYIAYHYPFTYSRLRATLESVISRNVDRPAFSGVYIRCDKVTTTLSQNLVPVVTITAPGTKDDIKKRDVVFLSARVHPGESNSSWMMKGILDFLSSEEEYWDAEKLRSDFVFKIVPMLNPDGVINGNHRLSLAGRDLNRVWCEPGRLYPTIRSTKALVQYSVDRLGKTPYVYVDLHGHSRQWNVFMFGNNPVQSRKESDKNLLEKKEGKSFAILPERMNKISPSFSLQQCTFAVQENKAGSARIALWRDFSIPRCYTMESTYCGFNSSSADKYTKKQIGLNELEEVGRHLCMAILSVKEKVDAFDISEKLDNTTF